MVIAESETVVNTEKEVNIDEGSLCVSDDTKINSDLLKSSTSDYLKSLTNNNVQLLINKIWELPVKRVDESIVAELPKPKLKLPRARVVPKPKPLTKWEKFAKDKGIRKKKNNKSKLQWDEELGKWIPLFGYKRVKAQEQKEWLVEINGPNENPIATSMKKKEDRVNKNELQRLRNIARANNIKLPKVGIPSDEKFTSAQQLAVANTVARVSTASVGKFQSKLPKEKEAKDKILKQVPGLIKKRKALPNNAVDEKKINTSLVNDIINKKTYKDILTVQTAPQEINSEPMTKKRGKNKHLNSKTSKKPKAGKGERNMKKKTGGRKRR
ncbi:ribosome biogenesis regulatory protein homolog [Microplitis mediator]|uniref:ribosome biogenesis regulatory protein homolog n=1 Tax=Microplitis mediator TaxID=375433 RepID=UPI0025551EA1|nr:ribosome biogenesis regulatory protein homolog [Microplitis mediator]